MVQVWWWRVTLGRQDFDGEQGLNGEHGVEVGERDVEEESQEDNALAASHGPRCVSRCEGWVGGFES